MSNQQRKIIILSLPLTGHVNPILGFTQELAKNRNYKVLFYCTPNFENVISGTGAEFRCYKNFPDINKPCSLDARQFRMDCYMLQNKYLHVTEEIVMSLAQELDREKPDLIIYDCIASYAKWAIKILNENFNNPKNVNNPMYDSFQPKSPAPISISYATTVALKEGVYPNAQQMPLFVTNSMFERFWNMIIYSLHVISFCWNFGLKFVNPLKVIPENDTEINLIFTSPLFQPQFELFDKSFKFIGTFIDDKIRSIEYFKNKHMQEILSKFPVLTDQASTPTTPSTNKLVYASLGTLFNNDNCLVYQCIIDAMIQSEYQDSVNVKTGNKVDFKKITFIISTGAKVLKYFDSLIQSAKLVLPENIILVESTPQIEILKRASLFITHSGMNSINEAIHFCVPMICVPITGDQPLLANRVSQGLGLGIQLDSKKLTPELIRSSIVGVLSDPGYLERTRQFSELTKSYDGRIKAADEVEAFINIKLNLVKLKKMSYVYSKFG